MINSKLETETTSISDQVTIIGVSFRGTSLFLRHLVLESHDTCFCIKPLLEINVK